MACASSFKGAKALGEARRPLPGWHIISPVRDHFVSKASMALEEGSPDRVSKCCAEGPAAAGKGC